MSFKSKYTGKQIEKFLDSNNWEYLYDSVGDIVYYDSVAETTNSIPYTEWQNSLGIPIGIIVIPAGVDGSKAKICSLYSTKGIFGFIGNVGYIASKGGSKVNGNYILPSDAFTEIDSDDSNAKYSRECLENEYFSNSPWFGKRKSKDFKLYGTGGRTDDWRVPNSIWKNIRFNKWDDSRLFNAWYVPTANEIAFLISRITIINNAITTLNSSYGYEKYTLVSPTTMWTTDGRVGETPSDCYATIIDILTGALTTTYDIMNEYDCRPFCEWDRLEVSPYFETNIEDPDRNVIKFMFKENWTWSDMSDFYNLASAGYYPDYTPGLTPLVYQDDLNVWQDGPVFPIKLNGETVSFKDLVQSNVTYTAYA